MTQTGTIPAEGSSPARATVQIELCASQPPLVTLTPPTTAVAPGSSSTYTMTVTNQDGTNCPTSTFTLSYTGTPPGTLTPTSRQLAPGASDTATLALTTTGMTSNSYPLQVQASNSNGAAGATGTGSAALIVDGVPPTAPTGVHGSANSQGWITLGWNAASDNLTGISSYAIYRNGNVLTTTANTNYTDKATVLGNNYTYSVTATDGVGNVSPASTPAVTVDTRCYANPPTVTLSPDSQIVKPNGAASFSIAVTNNDSPSCAPTTWTLSHSGNSGTLAPTSLLLNPGQSGTATLSANTATPGTFTVVAQAADNDGVEPNHSQAGTDSALLIVDNTPPTPPPSCSGSINSQGQVTLNWSAAADTPSGVDKYQLSRSGTSLNPTTSGLQYTDTPPLGPTYSYAITAVDRAGNVSSACTVNVVTTCTAASPTVTLTPNPLGAKLSVYGNYTVKIANNDAGPCAATTFTLTASASSSKVTKTWSTATLAVNAGQSGTTTLGVKTTTAGSYTVSVKATDSDGVQPTHATAITGSATFIGDATVPTAPTGLQGSSTEQGAVTLTWTASTDASGIQYYNVYRNSTSTPLTQTSGPVTTYTDTTATLGVPATYTVAAVDIAGNISLQSNSIQVLPGCSARDSLVRLIPSSQMAQTNVNTSYTVEVVNQDSGVCPATNFTLSYTGTPTGTTGTLAPTSLLLSVGQSGTATLQVKSTSSASYTVQVKATDSDGTLPTHNVITGSGTFIADSVAPTVPTGLQAVSNAQGHVTLSWTAATDALSGIQGYKLYRNNSSTPLGQTTDSVTTYTDTTTTLGTVYSYTVVATDKAGNASAQSSPVQVIPGCVVQDPMVTLTPPSQAVRAGLQGSYTVQVTNQDSGVCPTTTFTLSYIGTPTGSLSKNSVSLGVGQSDTLTLQQVSTATSGSYPVQVKATDSDGTLPSHNPVTGSATFIADGTAPTAPTGLQGVSDKQGRITLGWSASTDTLTSVQSYTVYRNGTLLESTATTDYLDAPPVGTIYAYTVTATDAVGNVSPASTPLNVASGCVTGTPTVTLAPSALMVKPNGAASYTVTVTNGDSPVCDPTTFTLNYNGTLGGSLTPNSLQLNAGQSGSATLQVNTTATGSFTLQVQAADSDGGELNLAAAAVGSATLIVDGTAPTIPTILQGALDTQNRVVLSWTASTDNLAGVDKYTVYRNGGYIGQTIGPLTTYTDPTPPLGGTLNYTVAAVDRAGNVSAPSASFPVATVCAPNNPTVTLTPNPLGAKLNVIANYTVTVANKDTGACAATTFTLSTTTSSSRVTATLATTSLQLGPGQSGTTTLGTKTTQTGTYTVSAKATDSDGKAPTHTAITGSATFIGDATAPTTPTGLSGSSTEQGVVTLNWTASTDASGIQYYNVYRNGSSTPLGQTSGPVTTYTDTTATPGVTYTYTVAAVDTAGNMSAQSTSIQLLVGCSSRDPVVTLTPTSQAVKAGVNASYTVQVSNQDSGTCPATTFTLSYTGTPTGTTGTWSTTSLLLGVGQSGTATLQVSSSSSASYTVQVKATDGDGKLPSHNAITASGTFIADSAAPTAPTGLQGSSDAQGHVTLSWTAATDTLSGIQYYTVYRNNSELGQTTGLSYADSTTLGTTYQYTVKATDNLGNVSAASTAFSLVSGCATALPLVTVTPTTQAVKAGIEASYTVTVTNQDGTNCPQTTFTPSFSSTPSGVSGTWTPTSLTLTHGQSGTAILKAKATTSGNYALTVNVADTDGVAPSHATGTASVTFVSDGAAPTTPTGLAGTASPGKITLTWSPATDAQSGVQSYLVYRNNAQVAEVLQPTTTYTDTNVVSRTSYTYKVAAQDMLGNVSAQSTSVKVTAK